MEKQAEGRASKPAFRKTSLPGAMSLRLGGQADLSPGAPDLSPDSALSNQRGHKARAFLVCPQGATAKEGAKDQCQDKKRKALSCAQKREQAEDVGDLACLHARRTGGQEQASHTHNRKQTTDNVNPRRQRYQQAFAFPSVFLMYANPGRTTWTRPAFWKTF